MDIPHALRNWLHQLILAALATDVNSLADSFAREHPLDIVGPRPGDRWTDWEEWKGFLQELLAPIQVGELRIRLLMRPEIKLSSNNGGEAHLHWQLLGQLTNSEEPPLSLDCEALLVQENGRWVATSLHCRPLARDEGQSG